MHVCFFVRCKHFNKLYKLAALVIAFKYLLFPIHASECTAEHKEIVQAKTSADFFHTKM